MGHRALCALPCPPSAPMAHGPSPDRTARRPRAPQPPAHGSEASTGPWSPLLLTALAGPGPLTRRPSSVSLPREHVCSWLGRYGHMRTTNSLLEALLPEKHRPMCFSTQLYFSINTILTWFSRLKHRITVYFARPISRVPTVDDTEKTQANQKRYYYFFFFVSHSLNCHMKPEVLKHALTHTVVWGCTMVQLLRKIFGGFLTHGSHSYCTPRRLCSQTPTPEKRQRGSNQVLSTGVRNRIIRHSPNVGTVQMPPCG